MKKIIIVFIITSLSGIFTAHAQMQKGSILVGADVGKFDLNLSNGGNFTMDISPKVGYFIKNNLAIGGYVKLGVSIIEGAGTSTNYGIGGLGRYYINDKEINLLKKGRFFLEATLGIEGNNKASGGNTNGLGLGFGPGYSYLISPNIALEGLLKYNGIVGIGSSATNNDLLLGIGFQIYLPYKKVATIIKTAN